MNEILVSVADVIALDSNGNGLFYGKTNISSAFNITMQSTDVRAGINAPKIYSYKHSRDITVKCQVATVSEAVIAMNAGATITTGAKNVLWTERIVLSGGSGTLTYTPIGNVNVVLPSGVIETVTPTSTTISVSGGGNSVVTCIYTTSKSIDQVKIGSTNPPSIVDLYMIAEIRIQGQSTVYKYLQIHIPSFQIDGNVAMAFAAAGVSDVNLEGTALVTENTVDTTGDYLADVSFIPVNSTTSYSSIAALPTSVTFSAASLPDTEQITVYGLRGALYQGAVITSSSTFTKTSGSAALTVSAGGLITAGSASTAGMVGNVQVMYYDDTSGSLTDNVAILVTA